MAHAQEEEVSKCAVPLTYRPGRAFHFGSEAAFIFLNRSLCLMLKRTQEVQEEGEQETEAVCAFHHITELEAHGIAHQDCQKLADAGFCTVESVANATMRKLQEVKGISEQKATKLKEAAAKLVPQGFVTAATVRGGGGGGAR
jgi:predicted RecB family nuclease